MAELKAKIGLETNAFETGLARLQNKVGSFAKGIGGLVVGAFAFDKLLSAMTSAISRGDQLQDLANKFGISASQLQLLGNAAELSGASLESVATALNKAAVNAQKAGADKNLADGFAKIGLSLADLQKATPQDILMKFADAAASGAIQGEEFALAVQLMGRSATDLLPTFRLGSDAIRTQGEAMGVWSDKTIAALGAASDAIKVISNVWTLAFGNIVASILPATAALARFLGLTNLANVIETKPPTRTAAVDTDNNAGRNTEDQQLKVRQQIFDIEEKIRQGRLKEPALAQELINKYRSLMDLATRTQIMAERTNDQEGIAQSLNLRLEATKIRERLAGMGGLDSSSMQILADSLQQVGGGGRFAQIGGRDTAVDYLRKLDDTNTKQLRALIEISGNTAGDAAGSGEAQ